MKGYNYERQIFGGCCLDFQSNISWDNHAANWQKAIRKTICQQGWRYRWDPKRPHTKKGESLFEYVKARLLYRRSDLELFCALGSWLDTYRGTDGFFLIDRYVVGFDLTTWEENLPLLKSGVVQLPHDWLLMEPAMEKIAELFNEQLALDDRDINPYWVLGYKNLGLGNESDGIVKKVIQAQFA